tara:strand:+ start:36 stop:266 length:231 start_codon:yes stop_codon:yes gene_type:complete
MGIENIFIGEKVPKEVHGFRHDVCKTCPYFKETTGTCGTLMVGGKVIHEEREISLCGCIVSEKTKYVKEECPAGKW